MQSQQLRPVPSAVERRDVPEQPPWGLQPLRLSAMDVPAENGDPPLEVTQLPYEHLEARLWFVDGDVEDEDEERPEVRQHVALP